MLDLSQVRNLADVSRVQARIVAPLEPADQAQLVGLLTRLVAGHETRSPDPAAG